MTTINQVFEAYALNTINTDTKGSAQNLLEFAEFNVLWNVTQGSATASHTLALKIQTCDTNSADDNDWTDLTPIEGSLNTVTGTGGTNEWPKVQAARFKTHAQYVRVYLDVTNGSWTTKVIFTARQVN